MGNGTLCEPNPCVSAVDEASQATSLSLTANPNPSTGQVMIRYTLNQSSLVTLEVFASGGTVVRRLVRGPEDVGVHAVAWDGRDNSGDAVATGTYFYRLAVDGREASKRIVLIR
jgi:flagellar hook assembly protein FlgD